MVLSALGAPVVLAVTVSWGLAVWPAFWRFFRQALNPICSGFLSQGGRHSEVHMR